MKYYLWYSWIYWVYLDRYMIVLWILIVRYRDSFFSHLVYLTRAIKLLWDKQTDIFNRLLVKAKDCRLLYIACFQYVNLMYNA